MKSRLSRLGLCNPAFDVVPLKEMIDKNDAGSWGSDPVDVSMNVVRSTNFNDTGYLDLSDVAKRFLEPAVFEALKLEENEILIERSGGSETQPVGRVSFITKEVAEQGFAYANFIQRISVKPGIDPKYLFYCLYQMHSAGFTQIMQNQTNGIRNLEYRFFLKQLLPKPEFTEQQKISSILSSVDDTIKATRASIANLERLKKSLMQNLLTGKMKPDGSWRKDDEFYMDDKFGKVPVGWGIKKLSQVFLINEKTLNSKTDEDFLFKYITIEAVTTEKLIPELIEKHQFKNAPSRARRVITKGDLLISTVRPNLKAFLRFNENGTDWICSTGFGVLSAKENQDSDFYFFQLLSFIGEKQFASLISGSNYPAISERDLKNIKVYEAPFDVQIEIKDKLISLAEYVEAKYSKITMLEKLKKSLMQKLLTGQVRVK